MDHGKSNALLSMSDKNVLCVFSRCGVVGSDENLLKENIKIFMKLGLTNRRLNALFTNKEIGTLCTSYGAAIKDNVLTSLLCSMNDSNYKIVRIPALILVFAGAHHKEDVSHSFLLHNAVWWDDIELVRCLFN